MILGIVSMSVSFWNIFYDSSVFFRDRVFEVLGGDNFLRCYDISDPKIDAKTSTAGLAATGIIARFSA